MQNRGAVASAELVVLRSGMVSKSPMCLLLIERCVRHSIAEPAPAVRPGAN
jgi:hypothetical protein